MNWRKSETGGREGKEGGEGREGEGKRWGRGGGGRIRGGRCDWCR